MKNKRAGFTLIELLLVITLSSIITGVVVFTLGTSLDTYYFVQDDVFLQKILDRTLQTVSEGDYAADGIKDSLEVVEAGLTSFRFVPPWVDDSHSLKSNSKEARIITLNRPFKAGTGLPLAEIKGSDDNADFVPISITFQIDKNRENRKQVKDKVIIDENEGLKGQLQFIYHPDVRYYPDAVMEFVFKNGSIYRRYKEKDIDILEKIPKHMALTDFRFQYFDNLNQEIPISPVTKRVEDALVNNISAVKLVLEFKAQNVARKGSVFVSLRNSGGAGVGTIIRKGSKVKIPNSKEVRALTIGNIIGVKDGGMIRLQAKSDKGQTWGINLFLAVDNDKEIIRKFEVEFPVGRVVYSEIVNLPVEIPINLMEVSVTGRYDYDFDKDERTDNIVDLEGNVELLVTEMDAAGGALFIRP